MESNLLKVTQPVSDKQTEHQVPGLVILGSDPGREFHPVVSQWSLEFGLTPNSPSY